MGKRKRSETSENGTFFPRTWTGLARPLSDGGASKKYVHRILGSLDDRNSQPPLLRLITESSFGSPPLPLSADVLY